MFTRVAFRSVGPIRTWYFHVTLYAFCYYCLVSSYWSLFVVLNQVIIRTRRLACTCTYISCKTNIHVSWVFACWLRWYVVVSSVTGCVVSDDTFTCLLPLALIHWWRLAVTESALSCETNISLSRRMLIAKLNYRLTPSFINALF